MAENRLYSVGTWDGEEQAYTPQIGVSRSFNITLRELRQAIRELRAIGYSAGRRRDKDGEYDSDPYVLIERTDGAHEAVILDSWKR